MEIIKMKDKFVEIFIHVMLALMWCGVWAGLFSFFKVPAMEAEIKELNKRIEILEEIKK